MGPGVKDRAITKDVHDVCLRAPSGPCAQLVFKRGGKWISLSFEVVTECSVLMIGFMMNQIAHLGVWPEIGGCYILGVVKVD